MLPEQVIEAGRERFVLGQSKKSPLSPLMQAKARSSTGEPPNACPFGCTVEDLDDHGYCRHLVGVTNGEKSSAGVTLFERMVIRKGKRCMSIKRGKEELPIDLADEDPIAAKDNWKWGKPTYEEVRPTDKLIQITTCARVYRDVDAEKAKAEKEAPAIAEQPKGSKK